MHLCADQSSDVERALDYMDLSNSTILRSSAICNFTIKYYLFFMHFFVFAMS